MGFVNLFLVSLSRTITVWLRSHWHFSPLSDNCHTFSETDFIWFCSIIVIQSLDRNAWLSCVYQSLSIFLIPFFLLKSVCFSSCNITAKNKDSKLQNWKENLSLCMPWNNGSKHTVIHVYSSEFWLKTNRVTHMHNTKFKFNHLPTTSGPQETEKKAKKNFQNFQNKSVQQNYVPKLVLHYVPS
jgi:hypothetical protein